MRARPLDSELTAQGEMALSAPPAVSLSRLRTISQGCGLLVILVAVVVLSGWALNIATLKSISPDLTSMKANTAIAFGLTGAALGLLQHASRIPRQVGYGCAATAGAIGAASLAQYVFGWDLGIDQLVFHDVAQSAGTSSPGRMAPGTALNFVLLATALTLIHARVPWARSLSQALALAAFAIGALAIMGYAYGVRDLYGVPHASQLAVHTASAFLLASAGVAAATPGAGLVARLVSGGPGGVIARRLLIVTLVGIPLLGWLRLRGQADDLYGTEFGVSVMVMATLVIFGALAWASGRTLDRQDGERRKAENEIHLLNAELERRVKERTAELEAANRAKDRFLASMSHELRTPLNAILGFTGTLLMELPGPLNEDQAKQLNTVQASGRHLLSLINDLLDVARIESGQTELKVESIGCQDLMEEVALGLRPLADEKAISLAVVTCQERLEVRSDRRALSQILINLTSNAIKFTDQGGVQLQLSRHTRDAVNVTRFAVVDTGCGIKPGDQQRLFAAFQQIDASPSHSHEGTGLGLYISHRLADAIGGAITLESELGKGSTFTLDVPAKSPAGHAKRKS
jgi:signal transduction histidine kinase